MQKRSKLILVSLISIICYVSNEHVNPDMMQPMQIGQILWYKIYF